jgi:hypothetical protein
MYAAGGINPPKNRDAARKSSKTGKTVRKKVLLWLWSQVFRADF